MLEAKLMDFHLDGLLNLPDITIERCIKNDTETILKVGFLTDDATCPHCQESRDELHQIRTILIRDLPISGQLLDSAKFYEDWACGRADRGRRKEHPLG